MFIVCHIVSIFTAYVSCTHTHSCSLCSQKRVGLPTLENLERSSAKVHLALNIRLAACSIGEQSRYYYKTIPVNSGRHYFSYHHVNDSVQAI